MEQIPIQIKFQISTFFTIFMVTFLIHLLIKQIKNNNNITFSRLPMDITEYKVGT